MSEDLQVSAEPTRAGRDSRDNQTLGSSTIYKLCEELISLRERNNRQHQEFERKMNGVRDELKGSFNSFAADTQRAYQQLRQELTGEKRASLALFNEFLDVALDLQHIIEARPQPEDAEALTKAGVARVYTPKDFDITAIMRDIVAVVDASWKEAA